METLALLVIIVALLLVLIKSAQMVEGTFTLLARTAKISEFIVGFVVLSLVTSLPEISIAVASSQSIPELSIGNMIGASAVLLTLILGINVVKFKKVEFKGKFAEQEVLIGIFSVFLMLLSVIDRHITVVEGGFMLLTYITYVIYLNYKFTRKVNFKNTMVNVIKIYRTLGNAIIGILILILASTFIVKAATSLAYNLSISTALIGVFLLGVGTNVPELTILLTSKAKKAQRELTIGNDLGSLFLNPGTVGLLTLLSGGIYITDLAALAPALVVTFIALILFTVFSYTGRVLSKAEGIIMIGVFFSLIITELIILIAEI